MIEMDPEIAAAFAASTKVSGKLTKTLSNITWYI